MLVAVIPKLLTDKETGLFSLFPLNLEDSEAQRG